MKKSTKSLWIYTAILFIIAIALILATTLLQARLISSDGDIHVLGSFSKNATQNIAQLTEENVKLTNELNALKQEHTTLKTDFENVNNAAATESRHKELMRQMYNAYKNDDYDALESILNTIEEQDLITIEQADAFIPDLYNRAKRTLESVE